MWVQLGTSLKDPKSVNTISPTFTDGCCSSVPPIQSSQLHTKPEQLLHRRARCFLDFPGASAKQDVTAIYVHSLRISPKARGFLHGFDQKNPKTWHSRSNCAAYLSSHVASCDHKIP